MKKITLVIVLTWFAVLFASAYAMQFPEMFNASHDIDGFDIHSNISNLESLILMCLPFVVTAFVTTVAYLWHKEVSIQNDLSKHNK